MMRTLILSASGFILISCLSAYVTKPDQEPFQLRVSGTIREAMSESRLRDALVTITWNGGMDAEVTDERGYFTLLTRFRSKKSLLTYRLRCFKDGYYSYDSGVVDVTTDDHPFDHMHLNHSVNLTPDLN